MKPTNENISAFLAFLIMAFVFLTCSYSPEFQTEPVKIETVAIKTICGPCLAYTDIEYIECGKRIGRYELAYADGVCRRKPYSYVGVGN